MIQAQQFVGAARALGFDFWAGVPCSFLTPFINYTIGADGLTYISSANEGDAVAAASGAALAGRRSVAMMQNSGLGNAVSPLTSLNYVFRIPVLLIITLRGEPGRPDEPQHELMGQITGDLLDTMRIPWRWFPDREGDVEAALQEAVGHMDAHGRPFALVMKKGVVAKHALGEVAGFQKPAEQVVVQRETGAGGLPTRHEVLAELVRHTPADETVIIGSTGFNGRELYAVDDRPNQLYMVGSMGCASSLGLGLALSRPDKKIIVVDGDGAVLMRTGNLATIGAYAPGNFYHLLLDNGVHESTGGQGTVSAALDYPALAAACGYRRVDEYASTGSSLAAFLQGPAPAFMHARTDRGVPEGLPRPSVKPVQVARRLMQRMGVDTPWAAVS